MMPIATENLAIAQHQDNSLWYATRWWRDYRPWMCRSELGEYVYLQQTTPSTLDMIIGHIILQIKKVLLFGVLLLEGWDELT
jgi:hypothetical protein